MALRQHRETVASRPGAARSSTAPASRSPSASRPPPCTPNPRRSTPRATSRSPPAKQLGLEPTSSTATSTNRKLGLRLRRAEGRSAQAADPAGEGHRRSRLLPGGEALLPAGRRRGAGRRLRGRRQPWARGSRALARQDARRPRRAARRSSRTRSGARRRRQVAARRAAGRTSRSRSTIRSRPTPRRSSPDDRPQVARQGRRRRSCMDPHTGQILAMANAPRLRLEPLRDARARSRRNRAVTDVYEPGSTFKLVTISGRARGRRRDARRRRSRCAPTIQVADRAIHDAETRAPSA